MNPEYQKFNPNKTTTGQVKDPRQLDKNPNKPGVIQRDQTKKGSLDKDKH
ncbi:hypothetical protein BH10PSE19_BH10PSE19_21360 [soil metagenome]